MKTLFLTAAAAALIFSAPAAFAADDHHGHPGGGEQHADHTAPAHTEFKEPAHNGPAPAMTMSAPKHDRKHGAMTTTTAAPTAGGAFREVGKGKNQNNDNRGGNDRQRKGHGNALQNIFGTGGHGKNNSRGNVSVHINFNRHNVTASHHFHYRGGAYRGPSGYSYHRYSYGQIFPSIYFGRDYWIDDYSNYGLSDPPDGCVWVRYGDDAVLVDEYSGEILEVVYGQFY